MRRIINVLSAAILILLTCSFTQIDNSTCSLTIVVNNLRTSNGVVQFALYNKEGSIPDEKYKRYFKVSKSDIVNNMSTVVFNNLPTGQYAVNILHDENNNGKLDKGIVLPKEGIGFSNYKTIGLSNRPNFRKAAFEITEDLRIEVKVIYM